ncbi:BnaC04g55810D [Brassica napus]|uniref:BnaC04g55810D protein n=1 Tax=Brassica napus TaxID=3708 RepID=A0A078IWH2_BRANA|nr:BnaC04g55810D [Brassica napus]
MLILDSKGAVQPNLKRYSSTNS